MHFTNLARFFLAMYSICKNLANFSLHITLDVVLAIADDVFADIVINIVCVSLRQINNE